MGENPYKSPETAQTSGPAIPTDGVPFKVAVTPLFVLIIASSWLGVSCIVLFIDGLQIDRIAFAEASALTTVGSFIGAWALSFLFPAFLSTQGVYGHSFWSMRRFVRWQDVTSARPFRFLNLRWVRIYAGNKVTWLPLFQSRDLEFQQEIRRFAPSNSPILKCLR